MLIGNVFTNKGSGKRSDDDAPWTHPECCKESQRTSPHAIFCATEFFGAPNRDEIIKYECEDNQCSPKQQEFSGKWIRIAKLLDQQTAIGNRWTR